MFGNRRGEAFHDQDVNPIGPGLTPNVTPEIKKSQRQDQPNAAAAGLVARRGDS